MYAIIENGTVVKTFDDLRAEYPNTSFPETIEPSCFPEGVVVVERPAMPTPGTYQAVVDGEIEFVDNAWRMGYDVQDLTGDALTARQRTIQQTLTNAVMVHMNKTAGDRGYSNIISLCTYATSTYPKFAAEGQAGVAWRDAVWVKCYEILAEVSNGTRSVPTIEQLIAELPVINWPA
jgi:hypothetical protein